MLLRLHVEVTKRLGPPTFSSFSVRYEIDLDPDLEPAVLDTDLDGFHRRIRSVSVAVDPRVDDELSRLPTPPTPPTVRHWIEAGRPGPHGQPVEPAPSASRPGPTPGRTG